MIGLRVEVSLSEHDIVEDGLIAEGVLVFVGELSDLIQVWTRGHI